MKEKVENPWMGVLESNIFLERDKKIIERFNLNLKQKLNIKLEDHDYYIHPDLLPEPYMGNPDANVILLFANPGYGKNERTDYGILGFKEAIINNLTHSKSKYPYYYLNPDFRHPSSNEELKYTDGGKWVRQRMGEIIDEIGAEALSQKIFTIQLHPYHSARFKPLKESFEGYEYAMSLFGNAIEKAEKGNALIVCARSYKYWNDEYKKLKKNHDADLKKGVGDNFIRMLYPRTTYFTPKHFGEGKEGEENFKLLIEYINKPLQPSL